MKTVLLGYKISEDQISSLRKEFAGIYDFQPLDPRHFDDKVVGTAEVLVLRSAKEELISKASACKWIHTLNAGIDDYLSIERLGLPNPPILTNSAGIYGTQISEHVFAMILAFTRGIRPMVLNQVNKRWESPQGDNGGSLSELSGRTIGVIGLGHIGLEIARRSKAFGLTVYGLRRDTSSELRVPESGRFVDRIFPSQDFSEILSESDFVVNVLPLTRETRGKFNQAAFSHFKTGSIFVSVGRGATVVEKDLVEALGKGRIAFAALDVFEHEPLPQNSPLWKMRNVLISPHCAGMSDRLVSKADSILRDNLGRYQRGEPLRNRVDLRIGY